MDRRRFLLAGTQVLAAGSLWAILGRTAGSGDPVLPGLDEAWAAGGTEGARGEVVGAPGALATAGGAGMAPRTPLLGVAHGPSPAAITRAAVDALGGMGRFVSHGARVVVKPNIGWDRTPEQAANTNPEVVAALVKMAFEAGAKSVLVMDNPCNDPRRCYQHSGIAEAVKAAGGTVDFFEESRVRKMKLGGERLKDWEVHPAIIEADVRINCPVAKHHGLSELTLGMKNWMGSIGGPRGRLHQDIGTSIVDLAAFFKPQLTVIDGVRILTRGGPQGGSLSDVKRLDTVIASADPVAAEVRGVILAGRKPEEFAYLAKAAGRGLGRTAWPVEEEKLLEVAAG
jgi:uncharacterized protein (DUF362 family)